LYNSTLLVTITAIINKLYANNGKLATLFYTIHSVL